GLDVAVHHAVLVRGDERVGYVAQDTHGVGHRELAVAIEPRAQRIAVDVRHYIVERRRVGPGGAGVQQRKDVRMGEPRGHLDLAQEAALAERHGDVGPEHLYRHLPPVAQVLGEVYRRHAAFAELSLDAVAIGHGGAQVV